jgi:hypothetical protein
MSIDALEAKLLELKYGELEIHKWSSCSET